MFVAEAAILKSTATRDETEAEAILLGFRQFEQRGVDSTMRNEFQSRPEGIKGFALFSLVDRKPNLRESVLLWTFLFIFSLFRGFGVFSSKYMGSKNWFEGLNSDLKALEIGSILSRHR
jgi:hypothetical protein